MKKNKYLILILKEKLIFIIAIILGILIFLTYIFVFYVPKYSTSTKVFVRNIKKQDIIADFGGGSTIYSESGFSNPLFNLIQVLQSDVVSKKVYNNLSKTLSSDFKQIGVNSESDWVKKYQKLIKAQIQPSTDIINITFLWPNKKTSDEIFQNILLEFKNVNLEIRKNVERKQRIYLDKQLDEIGKDLDNIREKIRNYKVENKAVDIENESIELTKARIDLQKQSKILRSEVNYYNKKLSDLSSQLNFPNVKTALRAVSIGEDPYLVELSQNLAKAQQNYAQLKSKFTDNYPEVIAVKNEISSLKKNIDKRKNESLGSINVNRGLYDKPSQDLVTEMAKVQAEKVSINSQLQSLENGINQLLQQESALPGKIMGLDELKKQESVLATAFENIKQKQLEAKIKENEIVDTIIILNDPSTPKLILQNLLMRFIGLFGVTLLGAFAVAIIKEDLENKWTHSQEIEEVTGKKVLGVIPWIKSPEIMKKESNILIHKSDSLLGISYGEIVTNLIRKSYLQDAQAISFFSTMTSRGKSSIIPNITATLARLNKSVIFVVTDYNESQELLKRFGIKPRKKKDLIEVIDRINIHSRISKTVDPSLIMNLLEEAFQPVFIEGEEVFQMLYTNKDVNMYDYVGTRGFNMIIEFLKQYYEFIIIDTPVKPIVFPEFSAISTVSDGIVIVSAMETNRDGLIKTIEKFEKNNIKILGIIARETNEELEEFFVSKES